MIVKLRERTIEAAFVHAAEALGCLVYKLHERNAPDRLLITPGNKIAFVELKRPGAKPRPEQEYEHARLRARDLRVFVVDSRERGIETLSEILYGDPDVLAKQ